jgi:Flp pilus assembly pilin Flp
MDGTMMNFIRTLLAKLRTDQRGLSTMEYSVLFVLIVVGTVGLWTTLGKQIVSTVGGATNNYKENVTPDKVGGEE